MVYMRTCFIFVFFFFFNPLISQEKQSFSVVVIGGGPSGLAAAIEANAAGANVTIVEKRKQYSREQYVFLMEPALRLLDKWGVTVPEMVIGIDDGEKIGAMKIKQLEIALEQRCKNLGIPKIYGELKEIKDKTAIISQQNQVVSLPYDLLVGADGTHSAVRRILKIALNVYGNSIGAIAVIPFQHKSDQMEFIESFKCGSYFLTNIIIPTATIISIQGENLSKENFISTTVDCGWLEEAKLIREDKMIYYDNIKICLQQSTAFSDEKHSVILLGDAAASASFLQGMGANCALETAEIAGDFFKTDMTPTDYCDFNGAMQKITDYLVNDSLFLFVK